MLSPDALQSRLAHLCDLLREAGGLAKARFAARDFVTETKGAQDFVSAVDRETEALIRARLQAACPDTGFLGEETGGAMGARTWVVDPIDGTSNFVRGLPFWCLSVALVEAGEPVLGAIYDPCQDELFTAIRGAGGHLNGRPLRVSAQDRPDGAILGLGFSFKSRVPWHRAVLDGLLREQALYRFFGSGALTIAHCAAGRIDGFWEDHMMPWDVAAGLVLAREAGAVLSDYGSGEGWRRGNAILIGTPGLAGFFSGVTGVPLPGIVPQNHDPTAGTPRA